MDYSTLNNGKIKVALAQTRIVWEEQDRNYEEAARRVGEAAGQKAEAVFFPEMSFTGFSMNTDITMDSGERGIQRMRALAQQYDVSIGFGWVKDCTRVCGKCENHYTIVDGEGNG